MSKIKELMLIKFVKINANSKKNKKENTKRSLGYNMLRIPFRHNYIDDGVTKQHHKNSDDQLHFTVI